MEYRAGGKGLIILAMIADRQSWNGKILCRYIHRSFGRMLSCIFGHVLTMASRLS